MNYGCRSRKMNQAGHMLTHSINMNSKRISTKCLTEWDRPNKKLHKHRGEDWRVVDNDMDSQRSILRYQWPFGSIANL